jgi:prepilin-type N-terminal cleavage/methylation domain-containing protein
MKKTTQGFTLIEILVVIGIIALLAAIVIIAINPARQFAQARNSQRMSNINTLLNGIGQNIADNKGVLTGCPSVGSASSTIGTGSSNVDLSSCLSIYIPGGIPMDPTGTAADTKYQISYNSSTGRYLICAKESDEPALGSPAEFCVSR